MNFVRTTKLKLGRPKWILANLVETTQTVTDNGLKQYDKNLKKSPSKRIGKQAMEITPRNEHSYSKVSTSSGKLSRDVFGATILPSNLSFDNMKKLSMNQIKLEDIPLVDENEAAEELLAEKMCKKAAADVAVNKDEVSVGFPMKQDIIVVNQDDARTDSYEDIPGPRLFESVTSSVAHTTRHATVFFLLRLLRSGSIVPFRKYGPIVRLPDIFGGKILLINRADHISALYEQDRPSPMSSSLDTLECSRIRRHGKLQSKPAICGSEWYELKRSIDNVLLKDEDKYFDYFEESGNTLIKRIRCVKNRENEMPESFISDVNKWSLECLHQMLFDRNFGFLDQDKMKWPSKNAQIFEALKEATRHLNDCDGGLQLWKYVKTSTSMSLDTSCQKIEKILSQIVYDIQMELQERDDSDKSDQISYAEGLLLLEGMTKKDVVTNLLDILLIGMNAITSALTFLLYHLARNPRAQKDLFKEIKDILPEKYSRLEYEHLPSLKYLQACLKESLRLKMPLPVLTKYLNRDVILSNFHVPKGTLVVMAAQAEALKEENFECAREFRPSRWLDSETTHPFTSLPLSPHSQGRFETRLAEMSVLSCAAQIVRNFEIEYNYGSLQASNSVISYPISPLKFGFFERVD